MSSFFCPQSLVFVRISPSALGNVYDSRLITHTSNLAFSSQLNTRANGGFYSKIDYGNYTLSGEVFNDIFFARQDTADPSNNPLFAIKESDARQIVFTNTSLAANLLYDGSPAVNGPVVTFRGDSSGNTRGVNFMDIVVFALEYDLCAKASQWDATSYANIVHSLQSIRALSNLLDSTYNSTVVCSSLTRLQITRELAKTYDAHHQLNAAHTNSAQKAVYSKTNSLDAWNALLQKLDGTTNKKIGYLAISILFRNTTPLAKDYEFKLHIKLSSNANSQNRTNFFFPHNGGFTDNANIQISGFTGF
tara:strand:- start:1177 stop:2091 length:915 start_codon:yes stop_codon:yes gene_type:complete